MFILSAVEGLPLSSLRRIRCAPCSPFEREACLRALRFFSVFSVVNPLLSKPLHTLRLLRALCVSAVAFASLCVLRSFSVFSVVNLLGPKNKKARSVSESGLLFACKLACPEAAQRSCRVDFIG